MGRGHSVAVSYGVGYRHVSDPLLLWLWCRLAAVALIQPLAWEFPYAAVVALRRGKAGVAVVVQQEPSIVSVRMQVRSLTSLSGLRSIATSCGVSHRCGSDPVLLWLWCRLAAVALIRPLAWELPLCHGCNHKRKNKIKWG